MATTAAARTTKTNLIETLVERGHHRPALTRLTLAALGALLDETPEAKPAKAKAAPKAEAPAPEAKKPAPATAGPLDLSPALLLNDKWTDADRATITDLATQHGVDSAKPVPSGTYVTLRAGGKAVAWVNPNRVDLPNGVKIRLSTSPRSK